MKVRKDERATFASVISKYISKAKWVDSYHVSDKDILVVIIKLNYEGNSKNRKNRNNSNV